MASASSWLLRVMAHALDADVAEQWRVLHTATTAGSQLTLFAQQILATEAAQSDAQLVRVVGPHSTLAHTFSTQLCHATLYAAKAVWCNPAEGENLEGIGMPMRTSVGVPFCCGGGGVSIFVAYLQRRVEEDGPRLAFLAQLQLLAASLEDLARSTAPPAAFAGAFAGGLLGAGAPADAAAAAAAANAAAAAAAAAGMCGGSVHAAAAAAAAHAAAAAAAGGHGGARPCDGGGGGGRRRRRRRGAEIRRRAAAGGARRFPTARR